MYRAKEQTVTCCMRVWGWEWVWNRRTLLWSLDSVQVGVRKLYAFTWSGTGICRKGRAEPRCQVNVHIRLDRRKTCPQLFEDICVPQEERRPRYWTSSFTEDLFFSYFQINQFDHLLISGRIEIESIPRCEDVNLCPSRISANDRWNQVEESCSPSCGVSIGSWITSCFPNALLIFVDQSSNDLTSSEETSLFAFDQTNAMSKGSKLLDGLWRDTFFDEHFTGQLILLICSRGNARSETEPRSIQSLLNVHSKVKEVTKDLQLSLWLHESSHHAETGEKVAVLVGDHRGNDGVIRTFARLKRIGMLIVVVQHEVRSSVLQSESAVTRNGSRAESRIVGEDEGTGVPFVVRHGEINRVRRLKRIAVFHSSIDLTRIEVFDASR